jgi:TolB-like protein
MSKTRFFIPALFLLTLISSQLAAADPHYTVAIFSFSERGAETSGYGDNVRDLLFAGLLDNPRLVMVERSDLDKILAEAELNLSGVIAADQAIQIGKLTGAKVIITGSIFKLGNKTYIVAKIIGSETGRVLGKSVSGVEEMDVLVKKLAGDISKGLDETMARLAPSPADRTSRLAHIQAQLGGKALPAVWVDISERHAGANTTDPAAETEIIYFLKKLGAKVIDKNKGDSAAAQFRILGEGLSEFSTRTKNLVSVKARLEIKVLDRSGNVVAIDRQTAIRVGLNEIIAGKEALQEAAQMIAERVLPLLAHARQ